MKPIVQVGNDVLRMQAAVVEPHEFDTQSLQDILNEMFLALSATKHGVAIAAPQIGYSKQIFVISPKIYEDPSAERLVFINPTIKKLSHEKKLMGEGCLSVNGKVGKVKRATKARIRAQDEHGKIFELGGSGLIAHIFQHEIDHLHGILFIDTAIDIHDDPELDETKNK